MTLTHSHRRLRAVTLAGACTLCLAACGSSAGLHTTSTGGGSMSAMRTTTSSMAGMSTGAADAAHSKSMNPAGVPARLLRVDGITPIPTQLLTTTTWQHMRIEAMAMTAVPFAVDDGTREHMVKVPRHVSFHLMVNLNDARSDVPIPYASVWATISEHGRVVYDERQWPMLSEYLGPHYGNNVVLPGAGTYRLSLLISPPVAARHIEYTHIWLKPHRVTTTFTWKPPRS